MLRKEKINKCLYLYLKCNCIKIIHYICINTSILHYYTNTNLFTLTITFVLTNVSLLNKRTNAKTNVDTNVYTFVQQ